MMLVGATAVVLWRLWTHVAWRWFWVGVAVWIIGVALKFAWAIPLNGPILNWLAGALSHNAYLVAGSIYIGLLTGVFEIGVTLIAALCWQGMARTSQRGVAVGVGAGAFEAVLLGATAAMVMLAVPWMDQPTRDQLLAPAVHLAETTSLVWLTGPVERAIAVMCHVSSRALVLFGVARRRWFWPFVSGFLILTAIDTVAGYAHLAGLMGKLSIWWIESAILPAALASVPITAWCIRRWPQSTWESP
jgi:hypothetical protein